MAHGEDSTADGSSLSVGLEAGVRQADGAVDLDDSKSVTDEVDEWLMVNAAASGILMAALLWIYIAFQ